MLPVKATGFSVVNSACLWQATVMKAIAANVKLIIFFITL
jgi:hypothetical protein